MIRITIKTENAAFGETPSDRAAEVARILRNLAERLEAGFTFNRVQDINGNTVGAVTLTGKDRQL